jgi:hypothetical protein
MACAACSVEAVTMVNLVTVCRPFQASRLTRHCFANALILTTTLALHPTASHYIASAHTHTHTHTRTHTHTAHTPSAIARGFVNLGLLFLFVSSFRIAAENIRDYGLVSDVMEPPRGVTRRDARRTLLRVWRWWCVCMSLLLHLCAVDSDVGSVGLSRSSVFHNSVTSLTIAPQPLSGSPTLSFARHALSAGRHHSVPAVSVASSHHAESNDLFVAVGLRRHRTHHREGSGIPRRVHLRARCVCRHPNLSASVDHFSGVACSLRCSRDSPLVSL